MSVWAGIALFCAGIVHLAIGLALDVANRRRAQLLVDSAGYCVVAAAVTMLGGWDLAHAPLAIVYLFVALFAVVGSYWFMKAPDGK